MANTDIPRGLWPIRHLTGGEIRVNEYQLDVSNANIITKGDAVGAEDGDGYCDRASNNQAILGVCAGVIYTDADGLVHYSDQVPATKTSFKDKDGSAGVTIFVWDDPDIVFGIQADGNTTIANRFATFPLVVGDGNTTTKISIFELDTTGGTGDDLRILGKVNTPNNAWGANVDLEVTINDHAYRAVKAGV